MTTVRDILSFTEGFAPLASAAEWDNVGVLVGSKNTNVSTALLTLDITPETVAEAERNGADLMISHHPVIFHPLRSLSPESAEYRLAQSGIAALCLHTNLDRADSPAGVNRALADALSLRDQRFFPNDFLLIGTLEKPLSCDAFAAFVKNALDAPDVRFTGCEKLIRTVAVSSGGGGEGVVFSDSLSFDAFVTGEMKHHQFLHAVSRGVCAVEAGHFSTENIALPRLKTLLEEAFPEVRFLLSNQPCPCRAI